MAVLSINDTLVWHNLWLNLAPEPKNWLSIVGVPAARVSEENRRSWSSNEIVAQDLDPLAG